jgi:hypothetical protein
VHAWTSVCTLKGVGGALFRVVKVIFLLSCLMVLFQNCAQDEGFRSRAFVVGDGDDANNIFVVDQGTKDDSDKYAGDNDAQGGLPPTDGTNGDGGTSVADLDPRTCFQNYISVFEWRNPTANLMSVKPILGPKKLATLPLNQNGFSSPEIYTGWSIEGSLSMNPDSTTSTSIRIIKAVPASSVQLDCYLMRVADLPTLDAGLANVLYKNVGSDPSANTLKGFIRFEEQFIACRVISGNEGVEFANKIDWPFSLSSNQAFIIKRGCYK